jgi:uncharacterized protein (DUF58 family)
VTRSSSPKLGAYGALAGFGLLAALVVQRAELAVVAAPFFLVLILALANVREPQLRIDVELDRERVVEGDEVELLVTVRSDVPVETAELLVALPAGLVPADETPNPVALSLRAGECEQALRVRCERWGGYVLGDVHVRTRDRFGIFRFEGRWEQRLPLKVYPREEQLRAALRPRETQVFAGNEVARQKAEGIEFADLRPFAFGDRMRRINWRASARRRELWVNEHHTERNTDVVLFLDTFIEARRLDASTLDGAVRAAASLASEYLRQRDRVGLVSFGGMLRWFMPGSGLVQRYRIVDALLDTEVIENFAWKDIDIIPARTLPPQALVVGLTPLLDARAVNALLDLRARGFDLAVVEISPVPFATVGPAGEVDVLAHRLWQMRRESLRARFHRAGVAVVEWTEGEPLAAALEEAGAFRRFARLARA